MTPTFAALFSRVISECLRTIVSASGYFSTSASNQASFLTVLSKSRSETVQLTAVIPGYSMLPQSLGTPSS